jgi:electron transfer flavoprotein alpha subunit
MEILILCPFEADTGLISKAAHLVGNGPVRALVPAGQEADAARFGASRIHPLHTSAPIADERNFALWLAEKIRLWGSTVILAPATVRMRNILPMLAYALGGGLTADCTALDLQDDILLQTRPAFGNSLMATIRATGEMQLATVRPGTFRPAEAPCPQPEITPEYYTPAATQLRQIATELFTQGKPLSQAEIIVAGGLGVGSKEGFQKLQQLAERLGAGLGASRCAVDAGFAPYRCQVGITGVTVGPKIYIAVGISGAVQHLSGMSGSDTVIAINTDPKAPIFDYADYGIVGDWETVIQKILEEL